MWIIHVHVPVEEGLFSCVYVCVCSVFMCVCPPGCSRPCCDQPAWHKTLVWLTGAEENCSQYKKTHHHHPLVSLLNAYHNSELIHFCRMSSNTVTNPPNNTENHYDSLKFADCAVFSKSTAYNRIPLSCETMAFPVCACVPTYLFPFLDHFHWKQANKSLRRFTYN